MAARTISLGMTPQAEAVRDPVCGMTVVPGSSGGGSHVHDGTAYHFCAEMCKRKFMHNPAKYLGGQTEAMDAVTGVKYTCPMHPEVEKIGPGTCPKCGMALEPATATLDDTPDPEQRDFTWRLRFGTILGGPLLILAMADMFLPNMPIRHALGSTVFTVLQAILAIPTVAIAGWPLFVRAWQSVVNRSPNMFTLIGLGLVAALAFSVATLVDFLILPIFPDGFRMHDGNVEPYWESAVAIVLLVLLGQLMELRARHRTGEAVRQLLRLTPQTATVILPNGKELVLPVDLIHVGDRVRIRPGERIPIDGTITEGSTDADESMLTGEPLPVSKSVRDPVRAGTMNGTGPIVAEVTVASGDTALSRIVRLVGEAQRSRMPIQSLVDKVSAIFVPTVVGVAIVSFIVWTLAGQLAMAVVCAVSVLIVACPCALGLAAPMAVIVGIGSSARRGILFRDAAALQRLSAVDAFLFDKTGTLTQGKPEVESIVLTPPFSDENELLALAAAIERGSEHPLGQAIVRAAEMRGAAIPHATDVRAEPGRGIRGNIAGASIAVGNSTFVNAVGDDVVRKAQTVLYVARDKKILGAIAVGDTIRPEAKAVVTELQAAGLHLAMLTGDARLSAEKIAAEIGISEVMADVLPSEKHTAVVGWKAAGRTVAMVGDGINDAPALAAADVGIAMGTGTDVAIAAAAITLVRADLRLVVVARERSRATMRTIRQNLLLAFAYNIIAVPIAAGVLVPFGGGFLAPVWAAVAMSVSSLAVVLNSLRLGR